VTLIHTELREDDLWQLADGCRLMPDTQTCSDVTATRALCLSLFARKLHSFYVPRKVLRISLLTDEKAKHKVHGGLVAIVSYSVRDSSV
jgi:hypothetical protein